MLLKQMWTPVSMAERIILDILNFNAENYLDFHILRIVIFVMLNMSVSVCVWKRSPLLYFKVDFFLMPAFYFVYNFLHIKLHKFVIFWHSFSRFSIEFFEWMSDQRTQACYLKRIVIHTECLYIPLSLFATRPHRYICVYISQRYARHNTSTESHSLWSVNVGHW